MARTNTNQGGGVLSVTNADGTLNIFPNTGLVVASVNQAHSFAWTALHTFNTILPTSTLMPVSGTQFVIKDYVDTFAQGLIPYQACRYATTANINLATNGLTPVDTGAITAGDRIMVKNQILQKDNGVYIAAVGAWTRATDFDSAAEIKIGAFFYITAGTVNLGARYVQYLFNSLINILGVDPIAFTLVSQAGISVTSFAFTNANGFTGVVTNPTTTPALTLSTSITGMLRGNAGALTAAGTGTDNHLVRYDTTNNIQDSTITLSDSVGGITTFSSPDAIYFATTTLGYEFEIDSGGDVYINAGAIAYTGGMQGAKVDIAAGQGGPTGIGGPFITRAGDGGSISGRGGHYQIYGGNSTFPATNSDGGDVWITMGNKTGTGNIGKFRIYPFFSANWSLNIDASAIATSDKTASFQNLSGTVALSVNNLGFFAATTSAQLAGVMTDETGTGVLVFNNSPVFLGNPTAPTQLPLDNSTKLATTAYVDSAVTAITGFVPTSRTLTINGTTFDLSANRTWTVGNALTTNPLSQFAATTSAQLAGIITNETGTGQLVFNTSPTFITPTLGVAIGTSLAVTGGLTSSGTAGIGYATGAGGSVIQLTSKATAVTLNKICGLITMNVANLANNATVSFTLNNTTIGATDTPYVFMESVGTIGGYTVEVTRRVAGSCSISLRNVSGGALAQAVVLGFTIIKGVIV